MVDWTVVICVGLVVAGATFVADSFIRYLAQNNRLQREHAKLQADIHALSEHVRGWNERGDVERKGMQSNAERAA